MIEALNSGCFCVSLDREALRRAIESDPAAHGLHQLIAERCPHLFAALPVFISRAHVDEMQNVIRAVEEVAALSAYREAALAWAPMLNAILGRTQRAELERDFFEMFQAEWRAAGREGVPARIAIVDEEPEQQFLYPEFLLFAQMFRRFGVEAVVVSPRDLAFEEGVLRDARGRIDLVYNRLTDFALAAPANAGLRAAYLAGAVVLSPHPRAHALYADKRNLSLLTDAARPRIAERS